MKPSDLMFQCLLSFSDETGEDAKAQEAAPPPPTPPASQPPSVPAEDDVEAAIFGDAGGPDLSQLSQERRTLPFGPAESAAIPESAGFAAVPETFPGAPSGPRKFHSLGGAGATPAEAPRAGVPYNPAEESVFAVPEMDADEIHQAAAPRKLFSLDYLLAALFAVAGFALVISTYHGFGLAWDESYYYEPARKTQAWIKEMLSSGPKPVSREAIDQAFGGRENIAELPMVPKIFFAAGLQLGDVFGVKRPYIAMRIPVALCYGLSLLILYLLAGKYYARSGAILSVLCYMTIPRVFGHAHIAGTETILTMLCLLLTYCFVQGLASWRWALLTGVVFGLAMATKFHAFLFPLTLILWAHIFQRRFYANNVFAMVFAGPLVMIAIWPWLWPAPFARLTEYLYFFASHNLTQVWFFNEMFPHFDPGGVLRTATSYPFIITAFTTPTLIAFLSLLGLARTVVNLKRHDIGVLYLLQVLFPLAVAALPFSPKYDGERLFLHVFPFIALLAGIGAEGLVASVRGMGATRRRYGPAQFFATILAVVILGTGVITISKVHPHELSHWNLFAGGVRGAHRMGMETTYWGEAVNEDVYAYLRDLPAGTHVRPLALHERAFKLLQQWGIIPAGLKISEEPPGDVIIMQAREGFFGLEESPLYFWPPEQRKALVEFEGVPFVLAFDLRQQPALARELERLRASATAGTGNVPLAQPAAPAQSAPAKEAKP